jgi:hypothetical protein
VRAVPALHKVTGGATPVWRRRIDERGLEPVKHGRGAARRRIDAAARGLQ